MVSGSFHYDKEDDKNNDHVNGFNKFIGIVNEWCELWFNDSFTNDEKE